jgi:diguanylate cyclase (GGDEF)-like protein
MRPNDAYFELIADTLDGLESRARAQFLQRFFLSLAHVEVPESKAVALWDDILTRRLQLSDRADSPIALHTALFDVLSSAGMFDVPVVIEYDALKNLHRSAVTDPLTGLYNRRLFNENFDKELNRARRYSHPLSLVTLDLHRFKEVNDKHGHPRGDDVLRAAANTLKKALRTSDSAFRIGGDEFALLLPQTDSSQAYGLSRRIGVVFAEVLRPLELTISVSMDHGVSTFPQDAEYRDQLIRIADERLYSAKQVTHQGTGAESPSNVSERAHRDVAAGIPPPAAPEVAPEVAPDIRHEFEPQPVSPAPSAPSPSGAPSLSDVREVLLDTQAAAPVASAAPAREPEPVVPPPPPAPPVSPLETSRPSFPVAVDELRIFTVPRKAERVSMAGTNAYAVLGDQSSHRARVVDLGFGGVALDFSTTEGIPDTLLAVLHVPILPPVRVSLKRVWTKQLSEETVRVGCCFIS